MSEVFKSKIVKIRKQRSCSWCGEQIEKGHQAHAAAGTFDGDFFSTTMHIECDRSWQTLPHGDEYIDQGMCRGCTCERGNCGCAKNTEAQA